MKKLILDKINPILLAICTFFVLSTALYGLLIVLDSLRLSIPVILDFRRREILFGIGIYLKTAIDFAIFIGILMQTNPGWKKKIAIAIGTSLGNAFGTFLVLTIWTIFKEISILMIIMVFLASIVLFRLAEESFEEFLKQKKSFLNIKPTVNMLQDQLNFFNKIFRPVLKFFAPDLNLTTAKKLSFTNLIAFSFSIPFVLGFDDFAGYIPLWGNVNVFGFTLGIMIGHMLLIIGLFTLPKRTITIVKHPFILIGGGLTFFAIGIYGFIQAIRLIISLI